MEYKVDIVDFPSDAMPGLLDFQLLRACGQDLKRNVSSGMVIDDPEVWMDCVSESPLAWWASC